MSDREQIYDEMTAYIKGDKPDPLAKWKWTPERVISGMQGSQMNTPYSDLTDAHNAAIDQAYRQGFEDGKKNLSN